MKLNIYRGTIGAQLKIKNPPGVLRRALLDSFTFENPAYLQAQRFTPYASVSAAIPKVVCLAYENEFGDVIVPRGIDPGKHLTQEDARKQFQKISWQDNRVESLVEFPPLLLKLNRDQRNLFAAFEEALALKSRPFGAYYFVAPTSSGKTILQSALAARTGQRTLVLCWTNQIKEVWFNELQKSYGFSRKDIGLIQQSKFTVGTHFTLASVQTLGRRRHLWPELFKSFGALIVDELQLVSAPSLFDFVSAFPGKYLLGATATDKANSATGFYLRSCFGWPVKQLISTQADTSSSFALKDVSKIKTNFQYEHQEQNLDFHDLCAHLASDEDRNQLIVRSVKADWDASFKPLVLTRRVDHAHLLLSMLKEAGVEDANLMTGETNADHAYTEKLVSYILKGRINCIVGTLQALKLGANLNPLSHLHLVMPVGNTHDLEQLIGRIRRRSTGKTGCHLRYYLDVMVPYLVRKWKWVCIPTFRRLRVPGYENMYVA